MVLQFLCRMEFPYLSISVSRVVGCYVIFIFIQILMEHSRDPDQTQHSVSAQFAYVPEKGH